MAFFSFKEKLKHFTAVAKGKKATKKDSKKYSKKEQMSYARGQMDARNEMRRSYAWHNATEEQRKAHNEQKKADRKAWRDAHPRNNNN